MRQRTRLDHEARIEEAVAYLLKNLDEPLDLGELADQVCMSRFHFHRVFQALLGETVGEMTRRLRMERAAHALRTTDAPITMIAFETGYATLEAFIRAFRASFGYSPSTFRKRLDYAGHLPTRNGVHFDDPELSRLRYPASHGEPSMNIEVREVPDRRLVAVKHHGPYYMIGHAFHRVQNWIRESGTPAGNCVGVFYDDPCVVPADQLRSHAGAIVSDDVTVDDPELELVTLPGGLYAVGIYIGPYDGLGQAWSELYRDFLNHTDYELDKGVNFEIYLDDCSVVPPDQLRTELYVSVKVPVTA